MATTPLPNMNPTGTIGSGTFNTGTGFGAAGTGTGGPGNFNFGNTMNPNPPSSSGSGLGTFPHATPQASTSNPGNMGGSPTTVTSEGSTTASANPYGLSGSQMNWMEKYLQETFSGGMGAMVYQYLMSNGGYNSGITQQAVDATTNAAQGQ